MSSSKGTEELFSKEEEDIPLIEIKDYAFSEEAVTLIVLYGMEDALKLLRLSSGWHYQIKLALEKYST